MRSYSQKAHRATTQYGTYPPSNSTLDHDASALSAVLDNATAPCHINASPPDESLETSPLPKDGALATYPPENTSPAASTEFLPSAPATLSTTIKTEQDGNFSKGEATSDVNDIRYQPVFGTSSGHRGGIDRLCLFLIREQRRQREPCPQRTRRRRCHRAPKHPTRAYFKYFSFHLSSTRIRVRARALHS